MSEFSLQVACVKWFKLKFKGKIIYKVHNEGRKALAAAKKDKAAGLLSGVPDLCIPHPVGLYHGLYVELKYGKNKLTENQENIIDMLRKENYKVVVCYGVDEFIAEIESYFLPELVTNS